jgi:hypothetical protein
VDRFLLDSNVYDQLLVRSDVVAALRRLVDERVVELLTTHIQRDQLSAVSHSGRPELLALFESIERVSTTVPLGVVVLGVSRWDEAKWSGEKQTADFDANLRTRPVHLRDGAGGRLCGGTADGHAETTAPAAVTCFECKEAMGERPPDLLRYRNTADALLIETARVEGATFVTAEKPGVDRGALERARRHGANVMHTDEFFRWVIERPA